MMNSKSLITIGITCFNAQDLIVDAIQHAKEQDWPNTEIIIVDDASSDNSVELIEDYIKGESNIRLYKHEQNKGFPSALNTIIENAKGEYLTFFDDDDVSSPNRLSKQHAKLSKYIEEKDTHLVMCYSNRGIRHAGQKEIYHEFKAIGRVEGEEPHGEMVADHILWHSGKSGYAWGMFGSCTLMVHKKLFERLGGFDPQFRRSAEWDMAIRCSMQGGWFIAVDEQLVVQTKTLTADKGGRKPFEYAMMLREKYKDYLKRKGVYLCSRITVYSRFHGGKGRYKKAFLYAALAMMAAPHKKLPDFVRKLFRRLLGR